MSEEKQPRKNSDTQIQKRIQEIVHPAPLEQVSCCFHRLSPRKRTLSFVAMVAFVLEMIWRQIGSVNTWLEWCKRKPGPENSQKSQSTSLVETAYQPTLRVVSASFG